MPIPMPHGKQITVQRNLRSGKYNMPAMEIATDHYDISYIVSGDRRSITPLKSFSYHAGDIATGSPYMYHRTVSESNAPYDNYLIKFTPDFIKPFINQGYKNIFEEIFEQKICSFTKPVQAKIESLLLEMLEVYTKAQPYSELILQGMLFRLLTIIYENKLQAEVVKYNTPLSEPIIDAIYFIENNYSNAITLEDTAKNAHFSSSYFSRMFSAQLGMSFSEYLTNVRIRHAKRLLVQSNMSVTDIALEVGYCNGDYLSARFKDKTGMTPTKFRKKYKA